MFVQTLLARRTKKKAIAAGTAFALANPLMSAFIAGVGFAAWYAYRKRSNTY
jgi:hypothetical protein